MVAIFTGGGSGLQNGSARTLGSDGMIGSAAQGRSGEQLFVNAANGNLLITQRDEFLVGRGPDLAVDRTYNALGDLSDDNGDNWRQSTERYVDGLTGTVNSDGSTVRRVDSDGSSSVYLWSAQRSAYVALDKAGADDMLAYSGTGWIWTDGDTQITERYAAAGAGRWRITEQSDTDGNTLSFAYTGAQLTRITTADGGWLRYGWSGANLVEIATGFENEDQGPVTLTRVRYGYDSSNRLTRVTVDLSPEDGSIDDGRTYVSTYAYHGTSRLVASISQTDGSRVDLGYDAQGRVTSVTQRVTASTSRTTSLAYGTGYTSVTDPAGQVTRLEHDSGVLQRIVAPPARAGEADTVTRFFYTQSRLAGMVDPLGRTTFSHAYDDRGNRLTTTTSASGTTTRTYGPRNELLTERQTGSSSAQFSDALVTRYVYDFELHLRYRIDPEGGVTEYRYGAQGELADTIEYPEHRFDLSGLGQDSAPGEAQLNAWRDGLADRSSVKIVSNRYDVRGNLTGTIRYAAAAADGSPLESDGDIRSFHACDSSGRLLVRADTGGGGEAFAYDGLGRVVMSAVSGGDKLSFAFLDEQLKTVVTHSLGRVEVMAYDAAGGLVSATETDTADTAPSVSSYRYDKLGRLRIAIDPNGAKSHQLFDSLGRKVAEVSALGEMTEYRYDAAGRPIATIRYAGPVSAAALAALDDPLATVSPAQIAPPAGADDIWSWQIQGDPGIAQSIDGAGNVTDYFYDGVGRLTETRRYSAALSQATLDSFKTTPPTQRLSITSNPYTSARTFYDRAGRPIGMLDGEGCLSQIRYDSAGQKIEEIAYANAVPAAARSAWFDGLYASIQTGAADRRTRYAYDGLGQLRYVINPGDQVIGYKYDGAGRRTGTIEYGAIAWMPSGFDEIEAALLQLGAAGWPGIRERWSVYDWWSGRLSFSVDPDDAVTGYKYDELGRVVRKVAYAIRFPSDGLPHPGVIGEWAESQETNPDNRVTRNYYNERDELIYSVDGENYVTGNEYDFGGRLVRATRWALPVAIEDGTALDALEAQLGFDRTDTRFAYDPLGRLVDSWDGEGGRRHIDYNPDGSVRAQTEAFGTADAVTTRFDYDGAGRLIARFDADGTTEQGTTLFGLDAFGNIVTMTDPNGGVTRRSYDKRDRLLSETDALGGVTAYEYDAFGDAIRITDPLGSVTQKSYDKLGRLILVRDAEDYVTENEYSMFGDLARVIRRYAKGGAPHAQDAVTNMSYDRLGRLAVITDAESGQQSFGRNAFGEEISYYNGIGWVRFKGYDHLGRQDWETRMVESRDSNGGQVAASVVTRFAYDSRGNRIRMTEAEYLPEQRTTNYVYDKANRLIETRTDSVQVVSQSDHMTTTWATPTRKFRYDARGNLIETIEANGARLLAYFDRRNRKTVEIDALGAYSERAYDRNGNIVSHIIYGNRVALPAVGAPPPFPPGGEVQWSYYSYDALNRLTASRIQFVRRGSWNGTSYVSYPGSGSESVTTQVYDAAGNVVQTVDANGAASWSYFDRLGRKVAEVDREKYLTAWVRDSEGNVLSERRFATPLGATPGAPPPVAPSNPDDRETVFTYDRNGRRLTETRKGVLAWAVGATGAKTAASTDSTIRYAYNSLGKVVRKVEANGDTVDYGYDMAGRLEQETRTGFTAWDGSAATPTVRYFYNAHGDLTLTRQGNAALAAGDRFTRYSYGPAGRLACMTDAAFGTNSYTYDSTGNLVTQTYARQKSDGSQVSEGILYTRDLLGRVISQTIGTWTGSSWLRSDSQDTAYDAFGQVAKTGVNGLWQMEFAYDGAGRLWRSNDDNGVWRFFVRDGVGNQTLTIESEGTDLAGKSIDQVLAIATANGAHALGAALVDGINATIAVYDKRGQLIETRMPKRELSLGAAPVDLVATRAYNAFGELANEVDVGGGRTDYAYNTMGRTVSIQRATVSVRLENGTVQSARPTETYLFDIAGRLAGIQDANGNLNTRLLLAGSGHGGKEALVTAEFHPDSGVMRYGYDAFGDLRKSTDEIGRATTMSYDGMGRLLSSVRGSQTDYYSYDMLGRRLKHWTEQLGAGVFESTDYDAQGRVVRAAAMGGDVTTTSFFWSPTLATPGMTLTGGWVSTTTYANGKTLIEYSDFFGREVYRKDLGGHEYVYRYDLAGRMTERTALAEDTFAYSHLNTGRVAQIATVAGPQRAGAFNDRVTTYGYDAAGNLKLERLVENGRSTLQMMSTAPRTLRNYRNMTASYDALGRITQVLELGSVDLPEVQLDYDYDAVGNVRHVHSEHHVLTAVGGWASARTPTDLWYRYDSMNRLVTSQGQLSGAQIVRGTTGIDLLYDSAGERVQTVRTVAGVDQRERYVYDALGNLGEVRIAQGTGAEQLRAKYEYNGPLGRLSRQIDYAADGVTAVYDRTVTYNSKGQLDKEIVSGRQGSDSYQTTNTYDYGAGAAYALGAVVAISTANKRNNVDQPASRTENDFVWYGGAVQSVTRYWATTSQANPFASTYAANAWGQLTSVDIKDGRPRLVTFVNDMAGEAVRRDEADLNTSQGDPHEFWYRFGGRQHGYVGNNGTFETSYQDSIANRTAVSGAGAFRLGATTPTARSDFDQNYDPITSYQQGGSGGSYTVQSGDTLSSIAASLWGDAALWYKLAEANGMTASVALIEGQQLVVPAGVQRSSNNASTFNPYDPLEALGDTSPTTPKPRAPQKKKKCGGVLGSIMLVVIAVVVTIVTSGAALAATGAVSGGLGSGIATTLGMTGAATASTGAMIAAGAVGSAVGSMVSQGIGVATGLQDRFSWKGVALAGLSGAVGGMMPTGGGMLQAAARGAAGSLLTQSVAVMTGLQDKFDWAGVAAAAVGGAASSAAGANLTKLNPHVAGAISSSASAIAGAVTRSLVDGTDFGDNLLSALPDVIGTTLGNMIAGGVADLAAEGRHPASDSSREYGSASVFDQIEPSSDSHALLMPVSLGGEVTPAGLLDALSVHFPGLSERDSIDRFGEVIRNWISNAGANAAALPGADLADVAMAQNLAIRIFYAAVATELPDFQWAVVGGLVAGQVGREIERLGTIRQVAMFPAFGAAGPATAFTAGRLIQGLIGGQIDVAADIGKYALAYRAFGASAVARSAAPQWVRTSFRLQAQADRARSAGDLVTAAALGREAAYALGVHEQQRLQKMWDDPIFKFFGGGGTSVGIVPMDIATPLGTIEAPRGMEGGLARLDNRLAIARNAFNFMHDKAFSPAAGSRGSSQLQHYFSQVFSSGHLRRPVLPDLSI